MNDASALAGQFRFQAASCRSLGSELWGAMCDRLADDLEAGGITRELLDEHLDARFGLALPLRLLGAIHYIALDGRAAHLAEKLPSCRPESGGGDGFGTIAPLDATFDAICVTMREHAAEIVAALDRPVQTNEVGRAAALIVAATWVAATTACPIHLTEIGCSAGLLLNLDRFRYAGDFGAIGPPDSPVVLRDRWPALPADAERRPANPDGPDGPGGPGAAGTTVISRAGVDPFPIDPTTEDGERRLHSFVWPEQHERRRLLSGAIELARSSTVHRSDEPTASWLSKRLSDTAVPGTARMVMHSIMWQYVDKAERQVIDEVFDEAGQSATPATPLVRVRFEPDLDNRSQVRVDATLWSGETATTTHLADSCYHGSWVRPHVPTWPPS